MNFKDWLDNDKYSFGNVDEYLSDLNELFYDFLEDLDLEFLDEDTFEKLEEILDFTDADEEDLEELDEKRYKRVVRNKKRKRKLTCKKGYKAKNGKCVRMTSKEKRVRSKAARRSSKKKKGKQSAITRKRRKSIKRKR